MTPLAFITLVEGLSQRQFWDFYAVFANGLEDLDDVDVDHIVNEAWEAVFTQYVEMVYDRLVLPGLLRASGVEEKDEDHDNAGSHSKETLARVRPELRSMALHSSHRRGNTPVMLKAMAWFVQAPEFQPGGSVSHVGYFTANDGVWRGLADGLLRESRIPTSRRSRAMSVDRMLAWSHHNNLMADYIGRWLPQALDARAHGNMNTLLARTSPSVRDALKSAMHGVGQPSLTMVDRVHAMLNRNKEVLRVQRNGNEFAVDMTTRHGIRPDLKNGDTEIWNVIKVQKRFTVEPDGIRSDTGEYEPFMKPTITPGRFYAQQLDTIIGRLEPFHTYK